MADEHGLNAVLRFSLSDQVRAQLDRSVAEVSTRLAALSKKANDLQKSLDAALKAGSPEAAKLRGELDKVTAEMKATEAQAKQTFQKTYMDAARQSAEQTSQLAEKITRLGLVLTAVGAGGFWAMKRAADGYVQSAEKGDQVAQRWLADRRAS